MLEKYELSPLTMMVLPHYDDFGHLFSRVVEENEEIIVKMEPIQVIERTCEFFGSNLIGRQKATTAMTGFTYKQPIAIEPLNYMYLFPTESPRLPSCIWLSHRHIKEIERINEEKSAVLFSNGESHTLRVKHQSLENQLYRTAQLRCVMEERIRASGNHSHPHSLLIVDPRTRFGHFF